MRIRSNGVNLILTDKSVAFPAIFAEHRANPPSASDDEFLLPLKITRGIEGNAVDFTIGCDLRYSNQKLRGRSPTSITTIDTLKINRWNRLFCPSVYLFLSAMSNSNPMYFSGRCAILFSC
ncbi:hypothetical protein DMENIID0001_150460 [Sergentomyia squamirostris]